MTCSMVADVTPALVSSDTALDTIVCSCSAAVVLGWNSYVAGNR